MKKAAKRAHVLSYCIAEVLKVGHSRPCSSMMNILRVHLSIRTPAMEWVGTFHGRISRQQF